MIGQQNLLNQSIFLDLWVGEKAHQTFVLSCLAFVSGQKNEEEAAILEVLHLYYIVMVPMSAHQEICFPVPQCYWDVVDL